MYIYLIYAVAVCAVILLLSAIISNRERHRLKIEYYTAGRKMSVSDDKGTRTRIAFISDLHDYVELHGCADRLETAIDEAQPELLLLGGDIISVIKESRKAPDVADTCAFLCRLAAKRPTIYAEGNHETRLRTEYPEVYAEYRSKLERAGVVFLIDGRTDYGDLSVYGVSLNQDYYAKRLPLIGESQEMPEKYLIGKLGLPDKQRYNILLMHSPLYLKEAAAWGADLVLSGHFHGGTIRLPGGSGLMSPQFHFFSKYCSGVHNCGNTSMIVSRGLGTHSIRLRLNDLPELSVVDIFDAGNKDFKIYS